MENTNNIKRKFDNAIKTLIEIEEEYGDHEIKTDEKMEKLKKRCDRYEKMLPNNICYEGCYYCYGTWYEGKGPKRCKECNERWCEDCEEGHKKFHHEESESE